MSPFSFFKLVLVIPMFWPLTHSSGQINPLRQAEKKMTQGNWATAHQLLKKALHKDTLNVEAELSLTRWFLNANNPSHQIDSAYHHTLLALRDFQKSPVRQKEKLKHNQTDSASIVRLRSIIDSVAFEQAKQANTEESYTDFLSKYQFARRKPEAIELRDEVTFLNALRQNTFAAFANFLERYPQSHRAKEAKTRYERLLFDVKTKDKKLKSYLSFAKEFPSSPYRREAEKYIFELTTCGGDPSDFKQFLENYPASYFTHQARDILFHVLQETDEAISPSLLTDSLKRTLELEKLLWAPIYKNAKYGFIDTNGTETFAPQFDDIHEEYKCGSIKDDILITSNGLVSRSGKVLTTSSIGKDIGYGFLKTGDSSCVRVVHKSGNNVIDDCLEDAWVLGGRFLVVKKNGVLGLYALNGRMLQPPKWNSIEQMDGVLVFDRHGKKIVCTPAQLIQTADGNPFPENMVFDEVRSVGSGQLIVSNSSLEGILNSNLEFVVPLSRQSLEQMPFGLVRKINDEYIIAGLSPELENTTWDSFALHRQWLVLRKQNEAKLFDTYSRKMIESNPDSLWFDRGLSFARLGDSIHIHVNSSRSLSIHKTSKLSFVKSADSIRYFFVEQKNKKTIFSIESGEKVFATDYDQIESLTADIFIVSRKNKKGLLNRAGKVVLAAEYDALVPTSKDQLSLLKDKKFGLFHLASGELIKPLFERNIANLDDDTLIAFKNDHFGLIDWSGKPITLFEFDEILPWAENRVWVKKGFEWRLFDFHESKNLLLHIRGFRVFREDSEDKLAFVQQENSFGVLSSERGMIVPASFSFITNLSNEEEPLYFTSKEVEEAGIWVVIYYDKQGKLLRKQVYEDDEYGRIVCHEH
jgi:hypothetical protein